MTRSDINLRPLQQCKTYFAQTGPVQQLELKTTEKFKSHLPCLLLQPSTFQFTPPSPLSLRSVSSPPTKMSHSIYLSGYPLAGTQPPGQGEQVLPVSPTAGNERRTGPDAPSFRVKGPAYAWPPGNLISPPMGASQRAGSETFPTLRISQDLYCTLGVVVPTTMSSRLPQVGSTAGKLLTLYYIILENQRMQDNTRNLSV